MSAEMKLDLLITAIILAGLIGNACDLIKVMS